MTILKFKDISTGHLTEGDAELLDGGDLPMDSMEYEYGWIVSTASLVTGDSRDEALHRFREVGFSEEFLAAAVAAGEAGCWLLRFDSDADVDPGLPVGGYGGAVADDDDAAESFPRSPE